MLKANSKVLARFIFGMSLMISAAAVQAMPTLAYVKNNNLYVVKNFRTGEAKMIAQKVQDYKVATGLVAYRQSNTLFLVKTYDVNSSLLIAQDVQSYQLNSDMLTYSQKGRLSVVSDIASGNITSAPVEQDVQDYKTP